MGGGGGGGTSTQTVKSVPPWAEATVSIYAQWCYASWTGGTMMPYAGDVTAPQDANELGGIAGLANRGRVGDPMVQAASTYLKDVINGVYLAGDPDLAAAIATMESQATSKFASVNSRIGKKAYYVADPDSTYLAQTLVASLPATYNARLAAKVYADNYIRERQAMNFALGYGVEMGKHPAIDAESLRRAGVYIREYLQNSYQINHKLFIETQEMAVVRLEIFGNCLRSLTGSQQTTQQTMKGNKMMGAVGGAMAGAYIGSYFGPWGTVIGAVVGGVIGWIAG